MTFDDFVNIDNNIQTFDIHVERPDNNDNTALVNQDANESDVDENETLPPGREAVIEALNTLAKYVKTNDVNELFCESFEYIQFEYYKKTSQKRQTKLNEFLKKK